MAQLYRDKLALLVSNSLKLYGNCVELPSSNQSSESDHPVESHKDFWDESEHEISRVPEPEELFITNKNHTKISGDGPSVNLNTDSSHKLNDYKPSVIGKKITAKKGVSKK